MWGKNKAKGGVAARHFDTLVSSSTAIVGDVRFSGGLHIDGRIKGNVVADESGDAVMRLSDAGVIDGNVSVPNLIINGTVNGDVHCSRHIELAPKASINGNVYYSLIEMAMGAQVNGNLVHQQEPAVVASAQKRAAATSDTGQGKAAEPTNS